jgi:3-oxoacyl-[acyl-carrier-protein] synthase-3
MIGIENIASYTPPKSEDNMSKLEKFSTDEIFIQTKIGFNKLTRKEPHQKSSDLCLLAFEELQKKQAINVKDVDFVSVCTQNPDYQIPHTSAIVHKRLGLSINCAAFDISLGCSGWVYGIHNSIAFMNQNDLQCGLFFTSDPYSEILDPEDKNTSLLFGDASTVTLITKSPLYRVKKGVFQTAGSKYEALIKRENEPLYMNGREIFNFVIKHTPRLIELCLEKNNLSPEKVDKYLFHQASKYIIDMLTKKAKLDSEKVIFSAQRIGNTVSSTIPILLEEEMQEDNSKTLLTSGFGVGLSMAATILERV